MQYLNMVLHGLLNMSFALKFIAKLKENLNNNF